MSTHVRGAAWKAQDEKREASAALRGRNSMASLATCSECGQRGGVEMRYRLHPHNFAQEWRRLCRVCAGGEWFSQRMSNRER